MRVSVVVPAYNDETTIGEAVRSALASPVAAEVIVVDDGSSDATAEVAAGSGDPRVVVLSQENAGPGAARNVGAAAATGSHLVFLDADDLLLPGVLEFFAAATNEAGDDPLLVRSGVITELQDGTRTTNLARPSMHLYPRGAELTGTFAIDRGVFAAVGGYDPMFAFGENSELLLRLHTELAARGEVARFTGRPTLLYRKRESGSNRQDQYRARKLDATERMFQKHADALAGDRRMLADHLAVATSNLLAAGRRRDALRAGARTVRVRPGDARAWGRLLACLVPFRPPRATG